MTDYEAQRRSRAIETIRGYLAGMTEYEIQLMYGEILGPALLILREPERKAVRPCDCECSRGQFCGGCGHAGCGRR